MAEEYLLDTCHFFEPDRVECAKRLAGGAWSWVLGSAAVRVHSAARAGGLLMGAACGACWPALPALPWRPSTPHPCAPAGLPLPYSYEPLLCEVLFGQMLRLPRPAFKPLMYSALMVDLCKLRRLFPRAMSACVR